MGFPTNMFLGAVRDRPLAGWICPLVEGHENPAQDRPPRQIYTGPTERKYVSIDQRV